MSRTIRLEAQAKINLRLKVHALGDSGYHSIETVFLRLALADLVTVSVAEGGGVDLDVTGDRSLVAASGPVEQNLALAATTAFCERADWHPHIRIGVEKLIPVGAGLGGGSSDAAAVLRALNALAPAPLPAAELLSLAGTIGSDVPFLASNNVMAVGWGRGERLMALPPLPERAVILAVPPIHVATGDAYRWLGRGRGAASLTPTLPGDAFSSWERVAEHAENDFSEVVAARYPVIETIRVALAARGARVAMLTGSGSTVFGVFDSVPGDDRGADPGLWREIRTATATHVVPLQRMD